MPATARKIVKAKKAAPSKAVTVPAKTGTAVMIRQTSNTPGSATETMVALAQSKDFDAVKFAALATFQENMMATQARLNYNDDFFAMQEVLPSISRDGKIIIRDKAEKDKGDRARVIQSTPYATFPQIMRVVKPILQQHHFTLNYVDSTEANGCPTTTGFLTNIRGGHQQVSTLTLPMDTSGSKNNVQGVGSAIAYAKRYIAIGLLNLVSHAEEDRDDDAKVAGDAGMAPLDGEQFTKLNDKLEAVRADKKKFCEHFGIAGIAKLPQKQFDTAMRLLDQKASRQ